MISSASPGATVLIPGGTYEESVTLPRGLTLCGAPGEEVVITPPEGSPGIILSAPNDVGNDIVSDGGDPPDLPGSPGLDSPEDPDFADGPGDTAPEPPLLESTTTVCNLTVKGATGHGILHLVGGNLVLEDVRVEGTTTGADPSSEPGHGVHVQGAESVQAKNLQAVDNAGIGVSLEAVMDMKFTVTDFVATPDPDAIGVIWPEYMPDPESMKSSVVGGNDGGGISVIWPEYIPNPDGSAPVQAIVLEGISLPENGIFGVYVEGSALTLDQTVISGTLLPEASSAPLDITTANGQGILAKNAVSVTMNNCIVEKNAGAGLVSAESGPLLLAGQNGIPRPSDDDGGEAGVIWPEYLPSNQFLDNAGGGIALIDPIDPEAGKADAPSKACNALGGVELSRNDTFGVMSQGACLRIVRSLIRDTQSEGDGIRVVEGNRAADVAIDAHSLITGNTGFGARLTGPGTLQLDSELSKNGFGGAWSRGEGAKLRITENARIAANRSLGIAALQGSDLEVNGALIDGTEARKEEGAAEATLGDGIWAIGASAVSVNDATIQLNARAGLLLHDVPSAAITLANLTFDNNTHAIVVLADAPCPPGVEVCVVAETIVPDCSDCDYGDGANAYDIVGDACLEIQTCDPSDPACTSENSCGDCTCPEDEVCTSLNCAADAGEELADGKSCALNSDCPLTDPCMTPDACVDGKCIPWDEQGSPDTQEHLPVGTPCDDESPCTENTTCDASGECTGELLPSGTPCDDGLECTDPDRCNPVGECQGTPTCTNMGNYDSCTLVTKCTGPDTCSGFEQKSIGIPCDDGDPCTTGETCADATNPQDRCKGGTNLPPGSACEDGNLCTTEDVCNASGLCVSEVTLDCDDDNDCTTDTCDPQSGCNQWPKPDGTTCGINNDCLGDAKCVEGSCSGINLCGDAQGGAGGDEGGDASAPGEDCPINGFGSCNQDDSDDCLAYLNAEEKVWLGAIQTCVDTNGDGTLSISFGGCQCFSEGDEFPVCEPGNTSTNTGTCSVVTPDGGSATLCLDPNSGGNANLGNVNLYLSWAGSADGEVTLYHSDDWGACKEGGVQLTHANGDPYKCMADSYVDAISGQSICIPNNLSLEELNGVQLSGGDVPEDPAPMLIPNVPVGHLLEDGKHLYLCAKMNAGKLQTQCTGDIELVTTPLEAFDNGLPCVTDDECPEGQYCKDSVECVDE
jgi:hypothetical protein